MKTDFITSCRMKKVRTKNTSIERETHKILRWLKIKFSQKTDKIPGKPDIIIPKNRVAIFVHGCFWHGHKYCKKGCQRPIRNATFWNDKIIKNAVRDVSVKRKLKRLGWVVLTIWECEIRNKAKIKKLLLKYA